MAGVIADVAGAAVLREVQRVMFRPWDWSQDWHCLGDAADVFRALWGVDPIATVRGLATTEREASRIVDAAGGLDPFAARAFEAAGLVRVACRAGAIGVGLSNGGTFGGRVAMICIAPGTWVAKTAGGFGNVQWWGEGWICRS
jgi:hypothetical protein